uniref:(northern house mosquito) hypothetical protein n=1 Tax=Culex pipiens TaxID=7175 RepID=A0A8D7ZYJ7_CULPI
MIVLGFSILWLFSDRSPCGMVNSGRTRSSVSSCFPSSFPERFGGSSMVVSLAHPTILAVVGFVVSSRRCGTPRVYAFLCRVGWLTSSNPASMTVRTSVCRSSKAS